MAFVWENQFLCIYSECKDARGRNFKLQQRLYHPYPVKSIKQEIFRRESIAPHCQQLTLSGRVLEDGHDLIEYNIRDGATLDLVVKQGSKYRYLCTNYLCYFSAGICGTCDNNFLLIHLSEVKEMAEVITNYDAVSIDELTVRVGDIVEIIDKEKDSIGWWKVYQGRSDCTYYNNCRLPV